MGEKHSFRELWVQVTVMITMTPWKRKQMKKSGDDTNVLLMFGAAVLLASVASAQ